MTSYSMKPASVSHEGYFSSPKKQAFKTPSPPLGTWSSPTSPALTTATSSPSLSGSPAMTRNDSVHSILVMWDNGQAKDCAQETLENASETVGLGFGEDVVHTEMPDDVSISGLNSNKGSPEVERVDRLTNLPNYSPFMQRHRFSSSAASELTSRSLSDSSSATLVSPTDSIVWHTDPVKTILPAQDPFIVKSERLSLDDGASIFTVSAYYDPDMASPASADFPTNRSSSASTDSTKLLLGLERARQMQRSRASTLESVYRPRSPAVHPAPIQPFSDRQNQLFGSDYTLGQPATIAPHAKIARPCKSFEVSTKTSQRACKGTPPPLPTKEDDHFSISPARQAAYQIAHDGYEYEDAYSESDAPPAISLVIDQEGFREIEASLVFARFIPDTHSFEYLVAQKAPLPYNCSKMQNDPVLRKLMVPVYGEKDFLTRQACLSITNNGVWEVCGKEGRNGLWRFTYEVEDRLSLAGKAKPGEKNIVPLRFTCSPEVLDSSRRVNLFKKLGKSLTPKLSASRLASKYREAAEIPPPLPTGSSTQTSRGSGSLRSHLSTPGTPATTSSDHSGELSRQQKYFYNHMLQVSPDNAKKGSNRPSTARLATSSRPQLSANSYLARPSTAMQNLPSPRSPVGRPSTADPILYLQAPLTPLTRPPSRQRALSRPTTPATPRSASTSTSTPRKESRQISTPPRKSSLTGSSHDTPKARSSRPSTSDSTRSRSGSDGRLRHRSISRLLPFDAMGYSK